MRTGGTLIWRLATKSLLTRRLSVSLSEGHAEFAEIGLEGVCMDSALAHAHGTRPRQSYSVQRSPPSVHRTRFCDALVRDAVFLAFAAFAAETSRMSRRQPTSCA